MSRGNPLSFHFRNLFMFWSFLVPSWKISAIDHHFVVELFSEFTNTITPIDYGKLYPRNKQFVRLTWRMHGLAAELRLSLITRTVNHIERFLHISIHYSLWIWKRGVSVIIIKQCISCTHYRFKYLEALVGVIVLLFLRSSWIRSSLIHYWGMACKQLRCFEPMDIKDFICRFIEDINHAVQNN